MNASDISDSIRDLLHGAEQMFGDVLGDIEPYNEPHRVVHLLFFRRFTEWQHQYCRAILALYEAACFQGTLPILRSLVEVSVAQILLQRDTSFFNLLELLNGERVKVDDALKQIGWPRSQGDIYAQLSRMAHPSRTSAFLGRTLNFEVEPLKSLVTRKDLGGIARVILWQGGPESEEAQQERWVFVALNTFDLAISSLFTLYGASAPDRHWWQDASVSRFEELAENYPSIKENLLWCRLPWQHSKEGILAKMISSTLNAQDGESDEVAS